MTTGLDIRASDNLQPVSISFKSGGDRLIVLGIFNAILQYIEGADGLMPVELHRDRFLAFIAKYDYQCVHAFSAYPDVRLYDIKDALGMK